MLALNPNPLHRWDSGFRVQRVPHVSEVPYCGEEQPHDERPDLQDLIAHEP